MMPLYEMLENFSSSARLHTPGHKGRLEGLFKSVSEYDVTELSVTDDLFLPEGSVLQSERLARDFFQTSNTFFSAGGATLCIQTALSIFYGKKVIVERNSHVSAFNAASLLDIQTEYIYNESQSVPHPISPEQVSQALEKNSDAAAVFITSPNYFGLTADLKSIKQICKDAGVCLVVDNSHGTHLFALSELDSAEKYADICIDSAHKTLPVLTGGAFLHFNIPVDYYKVKENMRLFGSTSPNFIILASLDYGRQWMQDYGKEEISRAALRVEKLKKIVREYGYTVLNTEPLRLTVIVNDGNELSRKAAEDGIYFEMATANTLVALFSPFNIESEFLAVEKFFAENKAAINSVCFTKPVLKTESAMSYKHALLSSWEKVPPKEAIGRICGKNILPYPPGIPVLLSGEKILEDFSEYTDFIYVVKL